MINWNKTYRIENITDKEIVYDNGGRISYSHIQTSFENVFVDFEFINNNQIFRYSPFINEPVIEIIKGHGITINSNFIPCYAYNCSEYMTDLKLCFNWRNDIDISSAIMRRIYLLSRL